MRRIHTIIPSYAHFLYFTHNFCNARTAQQTFLQSLPPLLPGVSREEYSQRSNFTSFCLSLHTSAARVSKFTIETETREKSKINHRHPSAGRLDDTCSQCPHRLRQTYLSWSNHTPSYQTESVHAKDRRQRQGTNIQHKLKLMCQQTETSDYTFTSKQTDTLSSAQANPSLPSVPFLMYVHAYSHSAVIAANSGKSSLRPFAIPVRDP